MKEFFTLAGDEDGRISSLTNSQFHITER